MKTCGNNHSRVDSIPALSASLLRASVQYESCKRTGHLLLCVAYANTKKRACYAEWQAKLPERNFVEQLGSNSLHFGEQDHAAAVTVAALNSNIPGGLQCTANPILLHEMFDQKCEKGLPVEAQGAAQLPVILLLLRPGTVAEAVPLL